MRRFLIVYTLAWLGGLAGAAPGVGLFRPDPPPGPGECGMWALPGMFLGGAIGAALAIVAGLRLTRPAAPAPPDDQGQGGASSSAK